MEDSDLESIREQRLAELRAQSKGQAVPQEEAAREEARKRETEMKNSILSQVLDQNARARLNSIALVKPEKAKMVENMLLQMAQTGQITSKLDEGSLISLLERLNTQTQKKTTVKFDRRRHALDSDDED